MKKTIRKYLIDEATLFPWIIAGMTVFVIYTTVIGIIGLFHNTEALMALLYLPYFIPIAVVLAGADYFFRKLFKGNLKFVWILETSLALMYGAVFYNRNYYVTEFITKGDTPLIALVIDKEKGVGIEDGMFTIKKKIEIPDDNILLVKSELQTSRYKNLKAISLGGEHYLQVYSISFTQQNQAVCYPKKYPLQLFRLESNKNSGYRLDSLQFDSLCRIICRKFQGK